MTTQITDPDTRTRAEQVVSLLDAVENVHHSGTAVLTDVELDLIIGVRARVRRRLGYGGTEHAETLIRRAIGAITAETSPVADTTHPPKPVKHRAPIIRVHEDGSECKHKIGPDGKPPADCPGATGYQSVCKTASCGWEYSAGIRAIVEEQRRNHLHDPDRPARPATAPATRAAGKREATQVTVERDSPKPAAAPEPPAQPPREEPAAPAEPGPGEISRPHTITIEISDEEMAVIEAAAELAGMDVATFVRTAALAAQAQVDQIAALEARAERAERICREIKDSVNQLAGELE